MPAGIFIDIDKLQYLNKTTTYLKTNAYGIYKDLGWTLFSRIHSFFFVQRLNDFATQLS